MPTMNPQSRLLISFFELLLGEDNPIKAESITRLGIAVSLLAREKEMNDFYTKELFGYGKRDKIPDFRIIGKGKQDISVRLSWTQVVNLYRMHSMNPNAIILIGGKRLKLKHLDIMTSRYINANAPIIGEILRSVLQTRTSMPEIKVPDEMMKKFNDAMGKLQKGEVY